jgi:hypothetical protein
MGVDNYIIRSLQAQVKDLERRLMLKSEKVLKLQEETREVRSDNTTLKDLNEQFAKENIRLRRLLMLEKRSQRLEEEKR